MLAIWNTLVTYYKAHQKHGEYRLKYAGIVGLVGYPLFYVLYTYVMPQPYENPGIRAGAAALCLLLALKDHWPTQYKRYYLGYSYFVILYCLPFFHTFMVLMNNGNIVFTADSMMAIFFTVLLVDWRNLLVMYTVGSLAGIGAYLLVSPEIAIPYAYFERIPSFILIVIGGTLFKHSYELVEKEKRKALMALGGEIAHEMRNSLSAMNLSLDSIRRVTERPGMLDDAGRQEINTAVGMGLNTIQSSRNVIDAILKSVADRPIDKSTFTELSAAQCVRRVLKEYVNQTGNESHIEADLSDDFLFRGDESLFHGVLYNLMKNALYYLPDYPDLRISIRLKNNAKGNLIEFSDTGPGIPRDIIPRLFSDFATFGKKDGTGLGLHFCRRVMRAFGGNIVCDSVEGEYTCFELSFPVVSRESIIINSGSPTAIQPDLSGKAILIVDDSETNRRFVTRYLKGQGAMVYGAADGVTAIDSMKKRQYDLVLMDIQMPRLNGLDAARWIRSGCCFSAGQAPNHRVVPIVACSSGDYRAEAVECGMNDYIQKPVERKELVSKIVAQLTRPDEQEYRRVLSGKRVLVVDDVEINRLLVGNSLGRFGLDVVQAASGQDALDLLSAEHVDLVLMDMQMPDMSGFEASERIRAANNRVPVIALTGVTDDADFKSRLYRAGLNDYILKTGDDRVIIDKLFHWLRWNDREMTFVTGQGTESNRQVAVSDQSVVTLFLKEAENIFSQLEEAHSRKEAGRFEELTHCLKGMAANMGALRLFDIMKQLNDDAKNGQLPQTDSWKLQTADACRETSLALQRSPTDSE